MAGAATQLTSQVNMLNMVVHDVDRVNIESFTRLCPGSTSTSMEWSRNLMSGLSNACEYWTLQMERCMPCMLSPSLL